MQITFWLNRRRHCWRRNGERTRDAVTMSSENTTTSKGENNTIINNNQPMSFLHSRHSFFRVIRIFCLSIFSWRYYVLNLKIDSVPLVGGEGTSRNIFKDTRTMTSGHKLVTSFRGEDTYWCPSSKYFAYFKQGKRAKQRTWFEIKRIRTHPYLRIDFETIGLILILLNFPSDVSDFASFVEVDEPFCSSG